MIDKKNLELWKLSGKPKIYVTLYSSCEHSFSGYFVPTDYFSNGEELRCIFEEETAEPFAGSNPWGVVRKVTGDTDCTWEVI